MTKEDQLKKLVQPKGYISKFKLYCRDCKTEKIVKKFGKVKNKL
jgi:hypothetical protein